MAERRTMTEEQMQAAFRRRSMTDDEMRTASGVGPERQAARAQSREMLGIDPSIERGTLLPLGRTQEGELIVALPEALVGVLESIMLPGQAMAPATTGAEPVDITEEDITRMALDVSPVRSVARAPKGGLSRWIAESPTQQQIKSQATGIIDAAKARGIEVKPEVVDNFIAGVEARLDREGVRSKKLNPETMATLRLWRRTQEEGRPWDLQELELRRREAGDIAGSPVRAESRAGMILKEEVDDFVGKLDQADLVGGDIEGVPAMLNDYRALWSRQAKLGEIENILNRAELGATGMENSLRNEFRSLLKNPKRSRGFTRMERQMMEDIVKGDALQKTLRFVSHFGAPAGGSNRFLGSVIGAGGGFGVGQAMGGTPAAGLAGAAALTGTGSIAGRMAAARPVRQAGALGAAIARGEGRRMTPASSAASAIARRLAGPIVGTGLDTETGPGYF